jgi:hypothetical protein
MVGLAAGVAHALHSSMSFNQMGPTLSSISRSTGPKTLWRIVEVPVSRKRPPGENHQSTRLRDINIEHSRLVKDKSALDRFARIAALRSERAILLGLLAGDSTLRLVSSRTALPAPHRQSA